MSRIRTKQGYIFGKYIYIYDKTLKDRGTRRAISNEDLCEIKLIKLLLNLSYVR